MRRSLLSQFTVIGSLLIVLIVCNALLMSWTIRWYLDVEVVNSDIQHIEDNFLRTILFMNRLKQKDPDALPTPALRASLADMIEGVNRLHMAPLNESNPDFQQALSDISTYINLSDTSYLLNEHPVAFEVRIQALIRNFDPILDSLSQLHQITEHESQALANYTVISLSFMTILFLFVLIITMWWLFDLLRRIQMIQQATTAFGEGQFDARVTRSGHDEISQIAQSFNMMAAKLMERFEALESTSNALRQSETRFRDLLKNLQIGVLLFDPNGQILLSNRSALELLGHSDSSNNELSHLDHKTLFGSNVVRENGIPFLPEEEPLALCMQTGQPVQNTVIGILPPPLKANLEQAGNHVLSKRVWLLVNVAPEFDEAGQIRQLICSFNDITARKAAEEQSQYLNRLRIAADISQQISSILDPDTLLQTTTSLLQTNFKIYLVTIYLYLPDQGQEKLVIYSSSRQISTSTIELHQKPSLIAEAARKKEIVASNDVRQNANFLADPYLPETRSEVAIPLLVGGQLLGVLDVQDKHKQRFTQADFDTFNTLAGQVAIQLYNARLFKEEREARIKLRDSELKFRSLVQSANDAIILSDTKGCLIGWNDGAEAIFGYQEEEVLGQEISLIMPVRYRALHQMGMKHFTETGVSKVIGKTVSLHGLRKDGTEFPLELSLTNWSTETGMFYSAIIRDITERAKAEEKLRENEIHLRHLFAQTQTALAETADHAHRLMLLNEMSEQMNIAESEEVLFQQTAFYTPQILSADHVNIALLNENKNKAKIIILTYDKVSSKMMNDLPFEEMLMGIVMQQKEVITIPDFQKSDFVDTKIMSEGGIQSGMTAPLICANNLLGTLNIGSQELNAYGQRDELLLLQIASLLASNIESRRLFSQTQRAKEAAEEARFVAESANRAKSEFLANMSHELRTPLNGILGYAQILRKEASLTQKQRDGIGIIQRSGDHLLTLINDILDLSKIEARRMEVTESVFDLSRTIKTIADSFRVRAEQKGISFVYYRLSELPTAVRGDEKKLRQILINLLGNAIKFTEKGQVALKVGLKASFAHDTHQLTTLSSTANDAYFCDKDDNEQDAWIFRFQVEDTGIGIKKESLDAIFRPFQQAGEENQVEGTGLGLAISYKLVEMLGSKLQVFSQVGEGSIFYMDLALLRAEDHVLAEPIPSQQAIIGELSHITHQSATSEENPALVVPDKENLSILYDLARRGNIRGVAKQATLLEQENPDLTPFANKLRELAKGFKMKEMRLFIEEVIKEQGS